jgi:hypothetical protein
MAKKMERIAITLYEGLRCYVPKSKKEEYDQVFASRKTFNSKFITEFFPKYVNFKYWIKKPKNEEDILLLNYFVIEVPVLGVTWSHLLTTYNWGNFKKYSRKHIKK